MKLLHAGITEAATVPAHPLLPGEADWTLGHAPSGWSEFTSEGQTYVYSDTGAYYSGDSFTPAGGWVHPWQDFGALTLVIGYNLLHTSWVSSIQLNDIYAYSQYRASSFHEGVYSMPLDTHDSPFPGSSVNIDASDPEGFVVLAGVMHSDGLRQFYRFDDSGLATVGSNAGSPPGTVPSAEVTLSMQNYDFGDDTPGTPGGLRIAHTYVVDEATDLSAITDLVTSWGWGG